MMWRGLWHLPVVVFLLIQPAFAQSVQDTLAAAQAGEPEAQYALGVRFLNGDGVAEDYAQSSAWFAKAAAQGHRAAQNSLGRYYHAGLGVTKDRALAIQWLEAAAQDGTAQHVFDLAKVLETDAATLPRAVTLYEQATQSGHAEAAVSLGVLYQDGRGVVQDYARAIALYGGPAQAGHPRALNNLGLMYVRGTGVAQDYEQAAALFGAAAEKGLRTAMTNLGVLYENGYGVPLDEVRAAELYRQGGAASATQGAGSAQANVLYDPRLQAVDSSEAGLQSIEAMARAGDPIAQFQMAWVLMQDPDAPFAARRQAAALFQSGAKAGHGPSMANFGMMYFRGDGLPQDYVLGYMWLLRARSAGVQQAVDISAELSAKMTAEQVNESQTRAQQ